MRLLVFKPGYDSHPPNIQSRWTHEDEQKRGLSKAKYHDDFYVECKPSEKCLVSLNQTSTSNEEELAYLGASQEIIPKSLRPKIEYYLNTLNKERRKYGADPY